MEIPINYCFLMAVNKPLETSRVFWYATYDIYRLCFLSAIPLICTMLPSSVNRLILQGDKNIIKFDGDHNSPRPQFYFDSINIFFHNVLQPPENEVGEMVIDTTQNYFGKVSWTPTISYLHTIEYFRSLTIVFCSTCRVVGVSWMT